MKFVVFMHAETVASATQKLMPGSGLHDTVTIPVPALGTWKRMGLDVPTPFRLTTFDTCLSNFWREIWYPRELRMISSVIAIQAMIMMD
jgi:hypothetical protein